MNLEKYGVKWDLSSNGYVLSDLENEETLLPIIHAYAKYLETDSLSIAASLFLKRYAVLIAASSLDYYEFQEGEKAWFDEAHFNLEGFKIYISKKELVTLNGDWKEKIFYEHLKRIIEILSGNYKINKRILWENVAVRLNGVVKKKKSLYPTEKTEEILRQLTESNPAWFNGQENPLQKYCEFGSTKRKTCCRYYLLEKKEEGMPYCLVCPLKKE